MYDALFDAPDHYCECKYNSFAFAFPIDSVMTEPVWFTATIDDLKQGMTAYWFSSDSVVMDVYAFCTSTEPTFSMTIGPNNMAEMDVEELNKKLEEMGALSTFLSGITPHIHVHTAHGGTGQVYCYPYDQGPHSTCSDALEMRPGMTYVCSEEENVYRLPYSSLSSRGKAFLQWKHKPKKASQPVEPAEVWLTLGGCEGDTVGSTTLSDSLHVFFPDSAVLAQARVTQQDLWVHVRHAQGVAGRVRYYNNPKYADPLPPYIQTTCEGKTLTLNHRTYTTDTVFTDTLWVNRDTLQIQDIDITFTKDERHDTVTVKESELRRGYVHSSGFVLRAYGDTVVETTQPNACTVRYYITVLNPTGTEEISGSRKARKQMVNGELIILVDDKKYNVLGQIIDK